MRQDLVSTASFLAQTRLFGEFSLNDLMLLAGKTDPTTYRQEEVIFRKGESGDTVYIIKAGSVKIVLPSGVGQEAILAIMYPGDLFGELSLLDGKPRSASAIAMEDVEAVTLRRVDFLAFLRKRPDAAIRILGILAARLRRTDDLLGESLFRDVPARLARALLELAEASGVTTDKGTEVALPSTRQDLASLIGTTTSTLNRWLKTLESQGIVQIHASKALILHQDALKRIAE